MKLTYTHFIVLDEIARRKQASPVEVWDYLTALDPPQTLTLNEVATLLATLAEKGVLESTGGYDTTPENPYYTLTTGKGLRTVEEAREKIRAEATWERSEQPIEV